ERVDYLPRICIFVPVFGIVLGIAALARQAWNVQKKCAVSALALIALFPAALQLSYIINDQTWRSTGRILSPHAYCLLFFLASAWSLPKCRHLTTLLVSILVYYFCIVGIQETNTAAIKNIFDIAKINRIVARVESVAPDLYRQRLPVVVVGALGLEPEGRLKKYPNRLYRAHVKPKVTRPVSMLEMVMPPPPELDCCIAPRMPVVSAHPGRHVVVRDCTPLASSS